MARAYANQLYASFEKSWTTDQLLQLGKQLGIDDAKLQQGVQDDKYAKWLESVTKAADARGGTGTPTVFVNNKMLNADQLPPSGLTAAVGAD